MGFLGTTYTLILSLLFLGDNPELSKFLLLNIALFSSFLGFALHSSMTLFISYRSIFRGDLRLSSFNLYIDCRLGFLKLLLFLNNLFFLLKILLLFKYIRSSFHYLHAEMLLLGFLLKVVDFNQVQTFQALVDLLIFEVHLPLQLLFSFSALELEAQLLFLAPPILLFIVKLTLVLFFFLNLLYPVLRLIVHRNRPLNLQVLTFLDSRIVL